MVDYNMLLCTFILRKLYFTLQSCRSSWSFKINQLFETIKHCLQMFSMLYQKIIINAESNINDTQFTLLHLDAQVNINSGENYFLQDLNCLVMVLPHCLHHALDTLLQKYSQLFLFPSYWVNILDASTLPILHKTVSDKNQKWIIMKDNI